MVDYLAGANRRLIGRQGRDEEPPLPFSTCVLSAVSVNLPHRGKAL